MADHNETTQPVAPEAPRSISIKGYYKGFSVTLTKREASEEFGPMAMEAEAAIERLLSHDWKPSWNPDTNKGSASSVPTTPTNASTVTTRCQTCGAVASEKKGISTKTGKPWHGVFCSTEDKTHTQWLKAF